MFQLLPALILLLLQSHGNNAFLNGRIGSFAPCGYGSRADAFLSKADRSLQQAIRVHLSLVNRERQKSDAVWIGGPSTRSNRFSEAVPGSARQISTLDWADLSVALSSVRSRDGPL